MESCTAELGLNSVWKQWWRSLYTSVSLQWLIASPRYQLLKHYFFEEEGGVMNLLYLCCFRGSKDESCSGWGVSICELAGPAFWVNADFSLSAGCSLRRNAKGSAATTLNACTEVQIEANQSKLKTKFETGLFLQAIHHRLSPSYKQCPVLPGCKRQSCSLAANYTLNSCIL